jgi:inositol-phosphate transport system permease protein
MTRSRLNPLALAFLGPALIVATLFFLLPVLLTAMFSFTSMSTSTGILGGDYLLTRVQVDRLAEQGTIAPETAAALTGDGYAVTEATLAAFGKAFGADRAGALAASHLGQTIASRREMERLLKDLPRNPIRSAAERKAAAALFRTSVLDQRQTDAAAMRASLTALALPEAEVETLTQEAYTGWQWTTGNFAILAQLPATWRYAANTAFYVVATLGFNIAFGLFLAISTFYLPAALANTFRAIWFLPRILPPVLYVLMWRWMTADQGFISAMLAPFGVTPRNWMVDSAANAWVAVILINGFVGASLGMILFSSALKALPPAMLHAAEVDGASRWQVVRWIILPQLRWPILFVTCYQTLSLLTSFEYILLATDGGPGRQTEVWSLAAYHTALSNYGGNLEYGLGAAYALVLVLIGLALSVLYLRLFNFAELVARPRIEQ